MISRVTVFCASSKKIDSVYFKDAVELGEILAHNKIDVYYGGGAIGLMGSLADTMLKNGGHITGIIPRFMIEQGWGHPEVDHIIVSDMHERKKKLADTDTVIALPGGVGTLEELLEMITLKQLGKLLVPIIILNTNGFFDPLLKLFRQMIEQQFMRNIHSQIWSVISKPSDIIEAMNNAPEWDGSALKYAPA